MHSFGTSDSGSTRKGRVDDEWAALRAEMAAGEGIPAVTDEQPLGYPAWRNGCAHLGAHP